MSGPIGLEYALPAVNDAPHICVTLSIPGDEESISNFVGAINTLALWSNYRRDILKRGKDIATVWKQIVLDIQFEDCDAPPPVRGGLESEADDMALRVKPDDSCIIQQICCGDTEFTDWYNPTECIRAEIAQQTGSQVPEEPTPAGSCKEWDLTIKANEQIFLPEQVSEGDTIEITLAYGAWSDGSLGIFSPWYWVNGAAFVGTGPSGSPIPADPSDLLTTAPHMSLIAGVANNWYPAYNTTVTVPSGVTSETLIFSANDGVFTDNTGTVTFHVKLCKSVSGTWSHTFDFTTGQHGWDIQSGFGTFWSSGVGFVGGNGSGFKSATITLTLGASYDFTRYQMYYNRVFGTWGSEPIVDEITTLTVVLATHDPTFAAANNGPALLWDVNDPVTANGFIFQVSSDQLSAGDTGSCGIQQITLFGTGPEPTWP